MGFSAEVLVIAQARIDGRFDTIEHFCQSILHYGTHITIDDIASDQDEVRLLRIDALHPAL